MNEKIKYHSIIFCSLSRGAITKIIDLPKGISDSDKSNRIMAQKILITNSMGFVIVDGAFTENGAIKHVILLYNINGNFVS